MAVAILDTSIYIDHWERGLYQESLESLRRAYIIRHSAVVLSELRRGARGREAERLVADLYDLATLRWEPSVADWWEAGRLVRNIGDKKNWDINKRRDFQNDALIALTARRHGATVVTANSSDFELLRSELQFRSSRLDEALDFDQNSSRRDSNNAAVQSQWSRTDAKILSERSRAVPDAIPKIMEPTTMRSD